MNLQPRSPEETYGPALEHAHQAFPYLDPAAAAARAGVDYHPTADGTGTFQVPFLGTLYHVSWPAGGVQRAQDKSGSEPLPADVTTTLILLHYLLTADGSPMADNWVAFRSLPGGLGYEAAFHGRASGRIERTFGSDRHAFEQAAKAIGGEPLTFGDASFAFRPLPRLWMATVLYLADDEFPASGNVLFDGSASHYLPTEDLAVLGGLLASRLIRAARAHTHG
ncbi:MAG: DUF3786 domain-containing protein [Anaerolineae bacterium]|nr:DUF3786 domain-containing protein [Anaerolineae bacterium]